MGDTHIIARGDSMPDYKEMYLTMVRASEDAINCLTEAQKKCEELYISSPEPELTVLTPDFQRDTKKDG